MTSISTTHSSIWSSGAQQCCFSRGFIETRGKRHLGLSIPYRSSFCPSHDIVYSNCHHVARKHAIVCSSQLRNSDAGEPEDENSERESSQPDGQGVCYSSSIMGCGKNYHPLSRKKNASSDTFRENLERIIGADDSKFSGADLAALIRNKYGRSYDVQLIKKEFMGRNLLALNVMWKYREQRSFPLTEEEYILRLDDVANTLKCWGAVSHIRNSLAKSKERPRIGKAVSIFIDMDDSGPRSNEWIYK